MKKHILLLLCSLWFFSSAAEARITQRIFVSPTGLIYGYGALPYWGPAWGWPVYSFTPYGYTYYSYWNYQPRFSSFGAISYSPSHNKVGVAWANATRYDALQSSRFYCGHDDCRSIVWVQGGCAALAQSQEKQHLAYAYHTTRYVAEHYARMACRNTSGGAKDCKVIGWVCSN